MKRSLLILPAVILLFLAAAGGTLWLRGPAGSTPLPSPNGYENFLQASLALQGTFSRADTNLPRLREEVDENATALALLRTGLGKESQVPIEFSSDYITALMPRLSGFKQLGLLLEAEARVALADRRTADAVRSYADLLRFSHAIQHGGFLIDRLAGIAFEAWATQAVTELMPELEGAQCRHVITTLEDLERRAEPMEATLQRERALLLRVGGVSGLLISWQRALTGRGPGQAALDNAAGKIAAQEQARRILLLALAARAFELEHGRHPSHPGELVPSILARVPTDPASGAPLAFE